MPNFADYDQLMADSDDFFPVSEPTPVTSRRYPRRSPSGWTPPRLPERGVRPEGSRWGQPVGVISVTAAISRMQGVLGNLFSGLWIAGEVSEISRPASGHVYFTLKEGDAQIACVYFSGQSFRHPATFRIGDKIEVSSVPDIYPKGGRLQL
ncbi:exodeoxyribonuclease VII large subunit, partial [gut metagenome]